MPRFVFQFGIEPYFMFKFQIGPHNCDCTSTHEAGRKFEPRNTYLIPAADIAHTARVEGLDSDCLFGTQNQEPASKIGEIVAIDVVNDITLRPCGRLSVLPSEIRITIYEMILVSNKTIQASDAYDLINVKESLVVSKLPRIPGLDARLLRTCRKIYEVRQLGAIPTF